MAEGEWQVVKAVDTRPGVPPGFQIQYMNKSSVGELLTRLSVSPLDDG